TREGLHTVFHTESADDNSQHICRSLDRLFHGYIPDAVFPDALEGDFEYMIPLTKDTNHFVVTLQQLSGEPIDSELVEFEITDDNTFLCWDNKPLAGNEATYHQWYKTSVNVDLSTDSLAKTVENNRFAGVIAELTTSRLMANSKARLKIYRTDNGETIASIRLIDALLLVMGYENSRRLTTQQYLDYKDEYNMIFFLDANHKWLDGALQIESWHVVYKDVELN
ncbi:MAG: FimB/Mfa2 family fimbrial subunit, partial [Muribaculaceae bacterium]|nr:FimB/Mfa2 family fimbrial subunit [Muribaculaceae bacterium]